MKHRFKGSHILAEFYGISNTNNNEDSLKICLENCCKQARLTLMKFDHVVFPNGGYTAFALLAESHISIHTYPEYQSIFLDVFTCGDADTMMIIDLLSDFYQPEEKQIRVIERGNDNLNM